ncbi:hypothetical protein [Mesorhizobium sp.]|nr:hypothetical protein [Mesorhizobium sp.]
MADNLVPLTIETDAHRDASFAAKAILNAQLCKINLSLASVT